MKGKISQRLEMVLRDPSGREQLRELLLLGRDGRVVAGNRSFALHLEVRRPVAQAAKR